MDIKQVLTLGLTLLLSITIYGQSVDSSNLLTPVIGKTLNQSQQNFLQEATQKSTVKNHKTVEVNINALEADIVNIELFNGELLSVEGEQSNQGNQNIWKGDIKNKAGAVILSISDNNIAGTITVGLRTFKIQSISGGLHVLIEIDQSQFQKEKCSILGDTTSNNNQSGNSNNSQSNFSISRQSQAGCNLRLLVAYTTAADNAVPDIQNLIQLSVAATNESYNNSNINHQARLAHTVNVNYSESGDMQKDLNRFKDQNDGNMDQIHDLRDLYSADVCILITDESGYTGLADAILATPDKAFAVVQYDYAVDNNTFPHEIGHLQGARHDTFVDASVKPFKYGHGFVNVDGEWRTVMAYNTECSSEGVTCTRLRYWSNPNINSPIDNEPMGTSSKAHNTRVLNETTNSLYNFRVPAKNVFLSNINVSSGEYVDVIATNKIEASDYTVQPGATVRFRAGDEIILKPGFESGKDFRATIEPIVECCSDDIAPVVSGNSSIIFQRCSGGGSQLCMGFNCADNYSVTVFDRQGNQIFSGSGSVDDNIACVWDGTGANQDDTYVMSVRVSNNVDRDTFNYLVSVVTVNCKKGLSADVSQSEADQQNTSKTDLTESNKELTLVLYPNPANKKATIEYSIPKSGKYSLAVFNSFGQKVDQLFSNKLLEEGQYKITFNVTSLSPGLYHYTMNSKTNIKTKAKKFILVK